MIEPMKEITIVFPTQHRDSLLIALQQEALVHFDFDYEEAQTHGLSQLLEYKNKVVDLLALYPMGHFHQIRRTLSLEIDLQMVDELSRIHEKIAATRGEIENLKTLIPSAARYGDFDPNQVERLAQEGIYLYHYRVKAKYKEGLAGLDWFPLFEESDREYLVVVSREKELDLPMHQLALPLENVSTLKEKLSLAKKELQLLKEQEGILLEDPTPLQHLLWELENLISFELAQQKTDLEGDVSWIQGYCPENFIFLVERMAAVQGASLLVKDAPYGPETPVRLKQNRWSKLFAPVMAFIGVLPGYDEKDANGIFLAFFTIFFAILVGDAGYALVMLGLSAYLQRKNPHWPKEIFRLFYLMGGATLIWGSVTGLWFGYQPLAQSWPLSFFVVPQLNAFKVESGPLMIRLAFLIGLIQLLLAHMWEFSRKPNWLSKLAELGWMAFLLGCYHLALLFLLGEALPSYGQGLFVVGFGLVMLFGEQQPGRNIFKGILLGIVQFPMNLLNAIGVFSDLVSYIRLFALGLATKEMAGAANSLAINAGGDQLGGIIAMVLILLVGHSINILLAAVAVMVHGIRLNFLEFAKHLQMEWRGKAFHPFQRADKSFT